MTGHWQDTFADEYRALEKLDRALAGRFSALCENILGHDSALIAFSGGTDSALLAFLSNKLLERHLCVISDSPTLSRDELADARNFARAHDLNLKIIQYNELENPQFRANNRDRCYYCKSGLFGTLASIREHEKLAVVFDGSNTDDLDDYRPGRKAVEENDASSPLLESGLSKPDIRTISRILGLETWDRPQMACTASRIPYGTPITEDVLARVEMAEDIVKKLGYKNVRIRYHGDTARIELGQAERIDLVGLRGIIPEIKKLKFKYVVLDLEGYRTGSLNE